MRKLLISLVVLLLATPLAAQWRRAGLYGADVRALIADPADPNVLYLGTSGGEIYVSRDGAKSWTTPRNGVPFPGFVVDNLLLDGRGRLWAASWGLWGGGVIAVSEDGGRTWRRRDAGLEDFSVRAIAVDANDPNVVLVGGLTGVYRSTDGGEEWKKISEQVNVESLAIDPRDAKRIFVGTWRQGWRSDDGGATWKHVANGMVLDTDMFSITFNEKNPDNMWVATCGWVYSTQDRGDLWTRHRDGFNNRRIHDVKIDPKDEKVVYAGSVAGLYRSEDAGKSWAVISDEGLVINSIVLHPKRPDRIVLAVEGDGVYLSSDRGKTFARSSFGLQNLRITTIVADPLREKRVYASVVFGGAASGIYASDDAGMTWEKKSTTALPEVLTLDIAPESGAEPRFIAGTDKGFFWSTDAKNWTQAEPSGFPIRVDRVLRFNRTRLFAATVEGVFTSRDAGRSWYRLGGVDGRAVDIAVGQIGGGKALFALTGKGLTAYDGTRWIDVKNAPPKGRTIAIRTDGQQQSVFIAGSEGVNAGRVDGDGRWKKAEAPDALYASVHASSRGTDQMLFLASRSQREILVGTGLDAWQELVLPTMHTEVTSVAADPFAPSRYYVGTLGEGVFVFEGRMAPYVAKKPAARPGETAVRAGG
ncbi:MAG: YCF48-related protein [Thermoanaerobaculia bacterium]